MKHFDGQILICDYRLLALLGNPVEVLDNETCDRVILILFKLDIKKILKVRKRCITCNDKIAVGKLDEVLSFNIVELIGDRTYESS